MKATFHADFPRQGTLWEKGKEATDMTIPSEEKEGKPWIGFEMYIHRRATLPVGIGR